MKAPKGWDTAKLGSLCDVSIGRTPARAEEAYWGAGHPWLAISDMSQGRMIESTKETITERAVRECNCKRVAPGTVLFSFKLSIGKVSIAAIPLFTNEAIAALPIKDERRINPSFLYWALKGLDVGNSVNKAAKGETLNKAKLEQLEIAFPRDEAEQKRISSLLDRVENLREQQRLAEARLVELLAALHSRALHGEL